MLIEAVMLLCGWEKVICMAHTSRNKVQSAQIQQQQVHHITVHGCAFCPEELSSLAPTYVFTARIYVSELELCDQSKMIQDDPKKSNTP